MKAIAGEMKASDINANFSEIDNKDNHFNRGYYVIPGESTELYRIQHKINGYTILEVAAPNGEEGNLEATIALMREIDPISGGPEFVDFYNNGYTDMKQYGIRIQKRGTGQYRPFVFDFYDGLTIIPVFKIDTDGRFIFQNNVDIEKWGDQLIRLKNGNGDLLGWIGRINSEVDNERSIFLNAVTWKTLEIWDNGKVTYDNNELYHEGNTVKGSVTLSGDGILTSFTIPHNLGITPSFYQVQEASADAGTAGISYITANSTNITVNFKSAPASGTGNIVLTWIAKI